VKGKDLKSVKQPSSRWTRNRKVHGETGPKTIKQKLHLGSKTRRGNVGIKKCKK